ncbi:MAG: hypothetical protein AUI14_21130 [Actinobacteria bacterium 13_2_20CM_2_71_6]|nr:MAG: hypothetical protein AUI14_21130 [Actinobacteria bacterium 13_2_20CM_2_71_6]
MRTKGRWHYRVGLLAAVAMVAVLLALPRPHRIAGGAAKPSGSALPALASVWPAAKPFPIPAVLADGSTYRPKRLLDADTSVGTTSSADGLRTALVVVTGGRVRTLQSELVDHAGLFQGIVATPDRLYWMLTSTDAAGHPTVGLWSAARTGGPAAPFTFDVGLPLMLGSGYDLQVVDDRLYWMSSSPGAERTELRSVPLAGGRVSVETIDGAWAMSAWPWLVTAPTATDAPMRLYNVTTRTALTVHVPAHQQISCSPAWCRIVPADAQVPETQLVRPDGSDRRRIGVPGALPVSADVAARDRFEPVLVPPAGSGLGAQLVVYDLGSGRSVLVAPLVTNAYADATHLWWSTGDNETLAWYGLDLRTLA